jgi:hypothetical protein
MYCRLTRHFVGKRRAEARIHLADQDNDLVEIDRPESRCQARCQNDMVYRKALPMTAPPNPDVVSEIP